VRACLRLLDACRRLLLQESRSDIEKNAPGPDIAPALEVGLGAHAEAEGGEGKQGKQGAGETEAEARFTPRPVSGLGFRV
jgi:hypothetical protein